MGYAVFGYQGINGKFFVRYNQAEAGSWARILSTPMPSNQEIESYKFLGNPPPMREWIGGRQERRLLDYGYNVKNRKFELTLDFDVNDLRRDKTGQMMLRVQDAAIKAGTLDEVLLNEIILGNGLCYDGQNFFDTDHLSGDSGTQKNSLGATEVPASNVATATAPTAAELIQIILQTIQYMYTLKDDTGDPINQNAKEFAIMVPPTFMAALNEALKNQLVAVGATTVGTNALLVSGFQFMPIVNPRLTWTDKLAIFRTDGGIKPFLIQEELPLETKWIGSGSEEEFNNDRWKYGLKRIAAPAYGYWQHAALVTLT